MSIKTHKEGFAPALLAWYDAHARRLPWRVPPGEARRAEPYHVLLSEVMLQQTTVAVVEKRFVAFLDQFPTVFDLALAPEVDVLAAWAGLGYYRRARSLHACARAVVDDHGGVFPTSADKLKALPGVGDYTSAAVAAIAFDQPAVVVDGNIERVVARVEHIAEQLPKAKKTIKAAAEALMPAQRFGDYAQALMDLGATTCRPKAPNCLLCPVRTFCDVAGTAAAEGLPNKAPKRPKREVTGTLFVLRNRAGDVLCEDRPGEGLFAGMLGLPGEAWDGRSGADIRADLKSVGQVEHVLTHRRLKLDVQTGQMVRKPGVGRWVPLEQARGAMPTLFVKALELALNSDDFE